MFQGSKAEAQAEKNSGLFKILAQHFASALHHCALYSNILEIMQKKKKNPLNRLQTYVQSENLIPFCPQSFRPS